MDSYSWGLDLFLSEVCMETGLIFGFTMAGFFVFVKLDQGLAIETGCGISGFYWIAYSAMLVIYRYFPQFPFTLWSPLLADTPADLFPLWYTKDTVWLWMPKLTYSYFVFRFKTLVFPEFESANCAFVRGSSLGLLEGWLTLILRLHLMIFIWYCFILLLFYILSKYLTPALYLVQMGNLKASTIYVQIRHGSIPFNGQIIVTVSWHGYDPNSLRFTITISNMQLFNQINYRLLIFPYHTSVTYAMSQNQHRPHQFQQGCTAVENQTMGYLCCFCLAHHYNYCVSVNVLRNRQACSLLHRLSMVQLY